MARTYNKPPILEAVCDFRFSSSQPWDWTIPGLFYERIKENFPFRETLATVETTVDPNQNRLTQQSQPKIRFVSEERSGVIQVAPHNLSIHQLRPYDNWVHFKSRILEYLQIYQEVAGEAFPIRLGLRYVNQIDLPFTDVKLEEFFRVLPQVPSPIPQDFSSFLFNVEVAYNSPESGLRIIFGTVLSENVNHTVYVLDLDMFSSEQAIPSGNQVAEWLEITHERIEVVFDAAFTDRTRCEIFEEVSK